LRGIRARRAQGQAINFRAVQKSAPRLARAALAHLGSWDAALRKAGIDPMTVRKADRPWTRDRILREIRSRQASGLSIRSRTVLIEHGSLCNAGRREFGTWSRAVDAAGIRYPWERAPRKWPEERILSEIRARAKRGLSLATQRVRREQNDLFSAAKRRFGSWTKARERAGLDAVGRRGKARRLPGPK
jgi:hypothetical protein